MMTCQALTELVTSYLERRLPLLQRLQFQVHLGMCGSCRAYLHQMRQTIDTLGKLPPEPIQPEIRDQLLEQFRDWKG